MLRLFLVVIVLTFTDISYGGVKGLLSIINSDVYVGVFLKGTRGVISGHKGPLNIIA